MVYLPTTTYVLYFYSFDICSNLVQGLGEAKEVAVEPPT